MLSFAVGVLVGLLVYPVLPAEWAVKPSLWVRSALAWVKARMKAK